MVKRVFVLISFVVTILVIVGNAFAHIPDPSLGPEWKFIAIGYDGGSYYINTKKITHSPNNIAKVWVLKVERGGWRRSLINALKHDLRSRGEDPNKAESYWYEIDLYKFNCTTHKFLSSTSTFYSFKKTPLIQEPGVLGWLPISHGSVGIPDRKIEKYVCNEAIPTPSLGPEWKLLFTTPNSGSTFYINTKMITHLPKGIVKVRVLFVPRGEARRRKVNILKNNLLFEGKDPNNAERFWYEIFLDKINCKTHQDALLEVTNYSFEKAVLTHRSAQHEKWHYIPSGTPAWIIESYVCDEPPPSISIPTQHKQTIQYKQTIPEPPLFSEWKLVGKDRDGTTFYVDTKRIAYLPEGIVKVWTLWVPRGDFRRFWVNTLKMIPSLQGKDPNNAERFWYYISLYKLNCKTHQFAPLKFSAYSFGGIDLFFYLNQHEKWSDEGSRSPGEKIEKFVCKQYKEKK